MGRRIGKAERLADTLEDKADTARFFSLAVVGWTFSLAIRGILSVFGIREDDDA